VFHRVQPSSIPAFIDPGCHSHQRSPGIRLRLLRRDTSGDLFLNLALDVIPEFLPEFVVCGVPVQQGANTESDFR